MSWIYQVIGFFSLIIFTYFLIVQLSYLVLLLFSIPDIFRRVHEMETEDYIRLLNSDATPPIAVLIPVFNEAQTIALTVDNLLSLYYRHKEIIVVNDGSLDETMDILIKTFDLVKIPPIKPERLKTKQVQNYYRSKKHPELLVVDKLKGGRIDALNAGLNACSTPLYVAIDGDTIVPEDSILRMIRPFVTDKEVIAIGGAIGIGNNCVFEGHKIKHVHFPKHWLAGFQVVEYLRSFIFGRVGWNYFGGPLLISGAFGIFDTDAVLESKGYQTIMGDDMDLTMRLHRDSFDQKRPYKIKFLPDVVAWTEAPTKLASLKNQRARWMQGVLDALWNNRRMFFNPKYKMVGMLSYPHMVLTEALSAVIEMGGYIIVFIAIMLNAVYWHFAFWLLLLALLYPMVLSGTCLILDDLTFHRFERWKDFWLVGLYVILEQFGYRQYLVWIRLKAMIKWLMNKEEDWPTFGREGFKN